jgi:phage terminase large subunit GpA-like protein
VPVWLVNSNAVKDQVSNMLGRDEPGGAMIHFPKWAEDWLYSQLTTEIRDDLKGVWVNPSRRRNEAFDLLAYCVAVCLHPDIRIEQIDWERPPGWAAEWDHNDLVIQADGQPVAAPKPRVSLADLGDALG